VMFHKLRAAWILLAAAFAPGPAKVEFEVASIKPAVPVPAQIAAGRPHFGTKVDGARVDIGTASLGMLIQNAYGRRDIRSWFRLR
jgi:hypothetical protein